MERHMLCDFLEASVRLEIEGLRKRGGPSPRDYETAREFADVLACDGDSLLFLNPGKTRKVFAGLARALAVASFCPGGITVMGIRFEAKDVQKNEGGRSGLG